MPSVTTKHIPNCARTGQGIIPFGAVGDGSARPAIHAVGPGLFSGVNDAGYRITYGTWRSSVVQNWSGRYTAGRISFGEKKNMSDAIESTLQEQRVFPPPAEFLAGPHISSRAEYERMYR